MANLPKAVYIFDVIPIKISMTSFTQIKTKINPKILKEDPEYQSNLEPQKKILS
jgi:hypothetical protein